MQEIIKPKERTPKEKSEMKRPQRMLSGLIKCGACGSGMSVKGRRVWPRQDRMLPA